MSSLDLAQQQQIATADRYLRGKLPAGADLHGLRVEQLEAIRGYVAVQHLRRQMASNAAYSFRPVNVTPEQLESIKSRCVAACAASIDRLTAATGPLGDGARLALTHPFQD